MDKVSSPSIFRLLSDFRHDLLNDLQLLLGHLQLGRSRENIYEDASKMVRRIQAISSLFACQDDELATLLWYWRGVASSSDICLQYEIEPLREPLLESSRLALEQIVGSILLELNELESEKPFLCIRISPTGQQLLLRCTPLKKGSPSQFLAISMGWLLEKTETDWRYSYVH